MFRTRTKVGLAALVAIGCTAALGLPQVSAQDDPPPAGATAAEQAGATGEGIVTYSSDGKDTTAVGDPRTAAANSDIEFVALGTACRYFDTRVSGGPLVSLVGRDFSVRDASIPGQGGKAGGCGIPSSAVAVDISISTVANSPTATGFVKVGKGGTDPAATVLQFLKNQGTSVTTTSALDGLQRLRIRSFSANTNMTSDILGYWEDTLHATVFSNAALQRGSGVASVTKYPSTGFYIVKFNRDVSTCTPVANDSSSADSNVGSSLNGPEGEVFVRAKDLAGVDSDSDFRLVMEC